MEEGVTATGGLGTPAEGEAGGVDGTDPGTEPGGLKGARGARGDKGAGDAGDAEGVRGVGGLRGPGLGETVADPTDTPAAGTGTPAAGTGLGGSFSGGSLTGEGEPVGKSGTGGVFWDGVSLTVVRRFQWENYVLNALLSIMLPKANEQPVLMVPSRTLKSAKKMRFAIPLTPYPPWAVFAERRFCISEVKS